MLGELPTSLTIGENDYAIRSNFRDVLTIIAAFNDPELEDKEKIFCCLYILYPDFEEIPDADWGEAFKRAIWFLDCGRGQSDKPSPRTMDWDQDEQLIFPAINKVAGFEVRSCEYLHWWTFMGYFMEISEGVFSHVVSLRAKKAKGKKLEKWEREYWSANKDICQLKTKLTKEEQEAKERLNQLIG